MNIRRRALWVPVIAAAILLLIAPAVWNGFPLLEYDTGGYLAPWYEGHMLINRAAPYGLLLVAGRFPDFWPVTIVQAALTVWVLSLILRAHKLGNRPLTLLAIVVALSLLTTLPWITAILLTDIFAGLGVMSLYLLLLHDEALSRGERIGLMALAAYSAATHSATLAVMIALALVAGIVSLVDRTRIPRLRLARATLVLVLGAILVFVSDGLVTGKLAWAPGGYALSFGRMLQDGIVTKYLDAHCPDATLKLCPYRAALPADADDFFWGGGTFDKLGRFAGLNDEMRRIAFASLADYPRLQLKSITSETAKQLAMIETGSGVVNWIWNTYGTIKTYLPAAVPAMKAARQQRTGIDFTAINALDVPAGTLAMVLLPVIVWLGWRRKEFADLGALAAAAMLAILVNAAVFGTLATAHDRYGARIVWLAPLVASIAFVRMLEAYRARLGETRLAALGDARQTAP
jgi:hypothetical protein